MLIDVAVGDSGAHHMKRESGTSTRELEGRGEGSTGTCGALWLADREASGVEDREGTRDTDLVLDDEMEALTGEREGVAPRDRLRDPLPLREGLLDRDAREGVTLRVVDEDPVRDTDRVREPDRLGLPTDFVGEEVSDGKGDGEVEGVTDGSPRQEICTVAFTDVDPVGSVDVNRMLVLPLTATPAGMVTLVSRRACRPFRRKPDQVGRFLKVATAEVLKVEPDATTTPPMVTEYAPTPLAQHRPSPPLSSRANSNSWPGVPQYPVRDALREPLAAEDISTVRGFSEDSVQDDSSGLLSGRTMTMMS